MDMFVCQLDGGVLTFPPSRTIIEKEACLDNEEIVEVKLCANYL